MPISLSQILRHCITNIPLRWVLTVLFVLPMIGSTALVGYLSYQSGQEAVADLGHQFVTQTNERVRQELKTYLQTPLLINRLNVDAVNQGQLNPQNVPALEAALFRRLQQFDRVSAILFASPQGTFRVIERFPNLYLGVADPLRPDQILFYRQDSQGRQGQLLHRGNSLDVRHDRPWYKRAVTTRKLGWNQIFQYGSSNVLTLNASQPVYERATNRLLGVFSVNLRLDYLSEFLHRLDISRSGQIIITDQSGALIATSTREQPYRIASGTGSTRQFKQLKIYESHDHLTRSLGEYLRDQPTTLRSPHQNQYLEFGYNGELQFVKITPFQDQYGLNWQILTVIPKFYFMRAIQQNRGLTALLVLLTLGAAIVLELFAANQLTARFAQLNRVSRELAAGNLDHSEIYALSIIRDISERQAALRERKQAEAALQESETRFRQLAETVRTGFFVFETESSYYSYVNPAYEAILGTPFQSVNNAISDWLNNIHPDDRDRIEAGLQRERQGENFNEEYRFIRPNGEIRWLHSKAFPLRNKTGTIVRVVGTVEDISDRKQLEQSLRSQAEEEHLLATITQNIRQSLDLEQILSTTVIEVQQTLNADRVLIFRLNPDGSGQVIQEAVVPEYPVTDQMRWEDEHFPADCYEYYRQGTPRIVPDVATDEWAGCLVEFLQEVGIKSKVVAPIVQVYKESSAKVWGLLVVHACSHYRQWQESEADFLQQICSQLAIAINQANLYQQLQAELAERKQAEEALRQNEERFHRAFDDAPIGIALVSVDGRLLRVNRSLCDIVGYTKAELLTRSLQGITYANDLQECLDAMQQMLADEIQVFQTEKRYLQKQGNTVQCSLNISLVKEQQPLYFIAQIQDISDRYQIDRMKDEFISVVSHELRTPLTSIRGALGILGSGVFTDRPEKAHRMLHIAIDNSNRLVRLVDDILSLERLDSGIQLVMEHCQVADLMQQAVNSVQALADQADITLSLTTFPTTLRAAPDAIIQTLTNLLSNAIKFSSPGDTVWLKAEIWSNNLSSSSRLPSPCTLFTVKDQGRGIPADKLQVIFERFQQVDVSDFCKKGGTGLGLAICKKIVQQHGGQIWAESSLDEGSTFYFALPLNGKDQG